MVDARLCGHKTEPAEVEDTSENKNSTFFSHRKIKLFLLKCISISTSETLAYCTSGNQFAEIYALSFKEFGTFGKLSF